jgi:2'-5' RNA ligase
VRLFVALQVPEPWRAIARAVDEMLDAASDVPMRFVDPSLLHITLRFLGEVPEERVPALDAALTHRLSPVDLALGLGSPSTFGPPTRTQAVWLSVRGDIERLRTLVRRVDLAIAHAGIEVRDHRFSPHLTLARLDRKVTQEQRRLVAELVGTMPPPQPFSHRVREAVLIRSTLGGARPVYEVIGHYR